MTKPLSILVATVVFACLTTITACGPSLGDQKRYTLTVELAANGGQSIGGLVLKITYDNGEICGTGGSVSCVRGGDVDSAVLDDEEDVVDSNVFILNAQIDKSAVMNVGDDLLTCTFVSSVTPSNNSFVFKIQSATDTGDATIPTADLETVRFMVRSDDGTAGDCTGTTGATTTTTSIVTATSTTMGLP